MCKGLPSSTRSCWRTTPHTRQPSGNLLENQRATFPVPYSQSRLSVSSNPMYIFIFQTHLTESML